MDRPPPPQTGAVLLTLVVLPVALAAYLVGLGGQHVPRIGDEGPYLQVTRLTAASGHLLPLQAAEGLQNTKPPLLFWLGIATTRWGEAWDLVRLRLPIVVFTFLVAWLVFRTTLRLSRCRTRALWAAGAYLAFFSTFQYGRPFLTNLPETFFVFLPFSIAIPEPEHLDRRGWWVLTGLSLGAASLFKSIALVVPAGVALAAWAWVRRGGALGPFLRRDVRHGLLALALAVLCFALWPLLDPDPASILHDFLGKENLGKVGGAGYLPGLFSRTHGLWTTLLGPFFLAGFLAPLVVALVGVSWRRRRTRSAPETALWILVLAFVVVFSVPQHRQANYLLPAMPAVAVLLALRRDEIPGGWFRLTAGVLAGAGVLGLAFAALASATVLPAGSYDARSLAVPVLATIGAGALVLRPPSPRLLRLAVLPVALGVLLSLACVLAPFEGGLGSYPADTVARLRGEPVWVPATFRARQERHRFLLPGADVRGYPARDAVRAEELLEQGAYVALSLAPGAEAARTDAVVGERLDLRTRQSTDEILDLLLHGKFDVLVQREVIVHRPRSDDETAAEGER